MSKKAPTVEIRRHSLAEPWTYATLDGAQRFWAEKILEASVPGKILLSEVAPVITTGRQARGLRRGADFYSAEGIGLYATKRGGQATYHGPGQWVLFCVDRLERMTGDRKGVRKLIEGLTASVTAVAARYGVSTTVRDGPEAGVWLDTGEKLASVGVQIDRGIVLHGVALNVYQTSQSFLEVDPCGLSDARPGFLSAIPLPDPEFEAMGLAWVEEVSMRFWR